MAILLMPAAGGVPPAVKSLKIRSLRVRFQARLEGPNGEPISSISRAQMASKNGLKRTGTRRRGACEKNVQLKIKCHSRAAQGCPGKISAVLRGIRSRLEMVA